MNTMRVQFKNLLIIFLAYLVVYGGIVLPGFLIEGAYHKISRATNLYYSKLKPRKRYNYLYKLVFKGLITHDYIKILI